MKSKEMTLKSLVKLTHIIIFLIVIYVAFYLLVQDFGHYFSHSWLYRLLNTSHFKGSQLGAVSHRPM